MSVKINLFQGYVKKKNYLALMFYLSALFCEFLLLEIFINNNFCLIQIPNLLLKARILFITLQIIYSEDFNDFYAREPLYIFKNL